MKIELPVKINGYELEKNEGTQNQHARRTAKTFHKEMTKVHHGIMPELREAWILPEPNQCKK